MRPEHGTTRGMPARIRRAGAWAAGVAAAVATLLAAPAAAQATADGHDTIRPIASEEHEGVTQPDDDYGYLMAHFVEDPDGYAEKIYFDLSRGDDPTRWDRLNGGEAILASDLGSTGVRDPYLVQNPNTGTYYLMATDLRVFGCQPYETGGHTYDCADHDTWWHGANLSRELVFWESDDLVNWSDPWTLTVAQPDQGMAWAPEATWDPVSERFVMYWSSKTYPTTRFPNQDAAEPGAYSKVQYGFTTDFRTDYAYGGVMIDAGHDVIDTTVHQYDGRTYRISKDNGDAAKAVYMEVTDATQWWLPDTEWETVETAIGQADYGAVEGPLMFKDTTADVWYVYVDQYGGSDQGYRPYRVTGLETGNTADIAFERMSPDDFEMLDATKHGVVRPLTRAEYDRLRAADAAAPTSVEVSTRCVAGSVHVVARATNEGSAPADIEVSTPYGSRVFEAVEPGARVSAAFSSRQAAVDVGEARADSGSLVDARAAYDAASCG